MTQDYRGCILSHVRETRGGKRFLTFYDLPALSFV
jgi:hypothetical protein